MRKRANPQVLMNRIVAVGDVVGEVVGEQAALAGGRWVEARGLKV